MSMTPDQINVDLFDQLKKLQDYKRRAEAEMLTMAQTNDKLHHALSTAISLLDDTGDGTVDEKLERWHKAKISLENNPLSP